MYHTLDFMRFSVNCSIHNVANDIIRGDAAMDTKEVAKGENGKGKSGHKRGGKGRINGKGKSGHKRGGKGGKW